MRNLLLGLVFITALFLSQEARAQAIVLPCVPSGNSCIPVSAANPLPTTGGGGGSPGGSNTQVQYNNSSAFGGTSAITTDGTNATITTGTGTVTIGGGSAITSSGAGGALGENAFTSNSPLTPGTTTVTGGTTGGFLYSDGTNLQSDANLKVTTPSASVGVVSVLGGGASVPQQTFVPNSGTVCSEGMANTGGLLMIFCGSTQALGVAAGGTTVPLNAYIGFNSSTAVNGALSAIFTSNVAGIISTDTTGGNNGLGQIRTAVVRGSGAVPTGNTGTCSTGVTVAGGASVGTWTSTAVCALAGTIILTNMLTQTNGYVCEMRDRTTGGVVIEETATTATTVTFTLRILPTGAAATAANDILQYMCMGY